MAKCFCIAYFPLLVFVNMLQCHCLYVSVAVQHASHAYTNFDSFAALLSLYVSFCSDALMSLLFVPATVQPAIPRCKEDVGKSETSLSICFFL